MIDQTNPHLFVDCHTTNGSRHQYSLTYDIPHNPATAEPIRTFLREKMMPVVSNRLEKNGLLTFYYGNFDRQNPPTKWTTYGHEPRYSTEYVGLRGRLAILSEAYSYIDCKDRIFATKDFVSGLLDYMTENAAAVHQLLDAVEDELVKAAKTEPARVKGGAWYLWHQMLAQQGYVIWMCDNQSASYRSAKHVWPVHRNFASNELADIERGVDWLKQQPWVDADRIGIWGWSYGGYMTAYALTHSKSFKMGISGAPVTDWRNYDSIYTERYMGLPKNNEEGYKATSVLHDNAANLHGRLLLIHGTIDDNVHLNNTIQFVKELQYAGKQFELMLYPSNRHSVKDKKQSAHLRKLMTNFVLKNL